jgi:hypothetical protein
VGASFSGPPLQAGQAIPNSLMMMPASPTIAAARSTKPRSVFREGMPAMLPRGGEAVVNE